MAAMTRRVRVYRHAQSLANAGGRTADPAGIPLTELGLAEAEKLAASVVEAPGRIISSPYRRALETARPLRAKFPGATYEVWPIQEFTYLNPASCVGTSWAERKPRIDVFWAKGDPAYVDGEGAESFLNLLGRARTFLADLAETREELIIAVAHGQFMLAARLMAEAPDMDPRTAMAVFHDREMRRPFANCERMELVMKDGRASVVG
jgi:2,3-bisphosphoglycerate-dependent phosphoglycerate mutase